jgi:S-DNA-T family DNA segregation ATPase FtsK/SpoIIIE
MAKNKSNSRKDERDGRFFLPQESKRYIAGLLIMLFCIILALSFFERSGLAGTKLRNLFLFLIGKTAFILPLIFFLGGLIFFKTSHKKFFYPLLLAVFLVIVGISGILEGLHQGERVGGLLGYLVATPLLRFFDFLVTQIIFLTTIIIGFVILWHLFGFSQFLQWGGRTPDIQKDVEKVSKPSLVSRVFKKVVESSPQFKVKEVPSSETIKPDVEIFSENKIVQPQLKTKSLLPSFIDYSPPPKEFLSGEKGKASPGDINLNASIIKKTLQNFDIPVEMSEINIGPAVTQYTLKPAEGIKLSRITSLSNDLSLALAAHPIRIEAPIPGKSLVGIEVPNKVRAQIGLRELMENSAFQNAPPLTIALGKDVSGTPVYADLGKMPHLLVAGSTGSGKTVMLNSLILSLIYKNSPEILRFILIDPKRVEFVVYEGLPHLLSPVIFDATHTVNALKWLIDEMERRFDVLSEAKTRDISSYNARISSRDEFMPYIVLIIDELADLMAARGREMEAAIVRLAQMARAVGIHLVMATQRPSVEVITGLIKANITSRITFQVASQVDSRTVLDTAGAEKLLGSGDLLYLSPEVGKPKRIQSAFVSEKEVKKVVDWLKTQSTKRKTQNIELFLENNLAQDLKKTLEQSEFEGFEGEVEGGLDPLYEAAKREVFLAKKASASFLQRRLRIGYARAARLLDMLEERGVVGPAEGAKPRQVYLNSEKENDGWQKV